MPKFSNKYWHQDYSSRHLSKNNIFQWNATSSIKSREGIPKPVKLRSRTKTLHFCQKCQRLSVKNFSWFRLWGKLIFDWLHQLCLFSSNSCLCLGTFFNPIKQPFIKIWTTLTRTTRLKYSKQKFWDGVGWGGLGTPQSVNPKSIKIFKPFGA